MHQLTRNKLKKIIEQVVICKKKFQKLLINLLPNISEKVFKNCRY